MQRHKQLVSPDSQILCQIILTNKYGCNINGGNVRTKEGERRKVAREVVVMLEIHRG